MQMQPFANLILPSARCRPHFADTRRVFFAFIKSIAADANELGAAFSGSAGGARRRPSAAAPEEGVAAAAALGGE